MTFARLSGNDWIPISKKLTGYEAKCWATSFLTHSISRKVFSLRKCCIDQQMIIWGSKAPMNKPGEVRLPSLGSLLISESFLRNLASRFHAIFHENLWGIHFSAFRIFPKAFKWSRTIRRVLLQALMSISSAFFENQEFSEASWSGFGRWGQSFLTGI
jgi:hypothetical protein